jgi:formate hydrogenlyase subunit 6/NADH:ubiquinone oxidoreductase subunit I
VILSKKLYLKHPILWRMTSWLRLLLISFISLFKKNIKSQQLVSVGLPFVVAKEEGLHCEACQKCVDICPTHALRLSKSEKGEFEALHLNVLRCVLCQQCEFICPDGVIKMGQQKAVAGPSDQDWEMTLFPTTKAE